MYQKIDLDYFWRTFEQILREHGEPYKIIHEKSGKQTPYANVNKLRPINSNCVDISLVRRKNFLRVGLYIIDRYSSIGQHILANRENINRELSFAPQWEKGEKNPNTLRVIVKFPIDDHTCRELINEAFPYIEEFIKVAGKYGKREFFDF